MRAGHGLPWPLHAVHPRPPPNPRQPCPAPTSLGASSNPTAAALAWAQGISEARRLERLQAGTGLCSPAKLRQLATLPALRHLRLCYTTKLARAHELAPSVYSVLPHLGSLDVGHEMTPCVEFLRLVGAGE